MIENKLFQGSDVLYIARALLGCKLVTLVDEKLCKGKIVEIEAYRGLDDKACHAYNGRRTDRTEVMYGLGGRSYVYLCYGIHHLFNVVTNVEGVADAILIRALEPVNGIAHMHERTNNNKWPTKGPGKLSKAMGIDMSLNNVVLGDSRLWIESGETIPAGSIIATTRVGVEYAEEDAKLPWRFYIDDNQWVSKK